MMKIFHRWTTAFALIALLASTTAQAAETLDRVVKNRTLVVGMSADQPPLNAVNRQGNYMGLDVDLARAIANAMRVQLEIRKIPFGELLDSLEAGRIDMVVSGMAITPERARNALFVGPYMLGGKSILASKDSITKFQSGLMTSQDLKLAALKNSTSATFIEESAPDATLVEVDDYSAAIAMLIAGDADGLVADEAACKLAVLRNPDAGLVTLEKPLTVEPYGIAVNADDPEFLNLLDNYLSAYERTGLLTALRQKWFEDSGWLAALP